MADFDGRYVSTARSRAGAGVETLDLGLRAFMLGIYNNMAIGLALTGAVAYGAYSLAMSNPAVAQALYVSPLKWVIMLAPLAFVFGLSAMVNRMQPATARLVFLAFAAVMGLSMSSIFLVFTGTSIARTFFITAASFGALSMWGYTTKRDISGWGSFLFMGLIGIILAMIVNLFLGSSALQFAISTIGVLIFAGLTAYDTQRLKMTYYQIGGDQAAMGVATNYGALSLYINFINLFQFLLHFLGERR